MKLSQKEKARIGKTVKCNCGHYNKDNYTGGYGVFNPKEYFYGGCCKKCGCTWYWPNDRYITQYKKRMKGQREKDAD